MKRDWREEWVDRMGLIVALSAEERFKQLCAFKTDMAVKLDPQQRVDLKECLRQRFTPTNGQDGCAGGTAAVNEVINERGMT